MGRNWTPSIVPTDHDQTIYLVVNNFRHLGTAFTETDVEHADLETVIIDLMSGPVQRPGSRGRIQHRRALGGRCFGRYRTRDSAAR
jgi:hypothetical protein